MADGSVAAFKVSRCYAAPSFTFRRLQFDLRLQLTKCATSTTVAAIRFSNVIHFHPSSESQNTAAQELLPLRANPTQNQPLRPRFHWNMSFLRFTFYSLSLSLLCFSFTHLFISLFCSSLAFRFSSLVAILFPHIRALALFLISLPLVSPQPP